MSIAGATRTQLKRVRGSMLGAAGVRYFARCPATAFRLQWSRLADPLIAEPMQMVKQWLRAMVAQPHFRQLLGRAWGTQKMKSYLASSTKVQWMKAQGPTTALIATLKDIGWSMPAPFAFQTPGGDILQMNKDEVGQVVTEIGKAAEETEMQHAAQQHLGEGMGEGGIDFSPAKGFINQLKKQGHHMLAGTASAVISGGIFG